MLPKKGKGRLCLRRSNALLRPSRQSKGPDSQGGALAFTWTKEREETGGVGHSIKTSPRICPTYERTGPGLDARWWPAVLLLRTNSCLRPFPFLPLHHSNLDVGRVEIWHCPRRCRKRRCCCCCPASSSASRRCGPRGWPASSSRGRGRTAAAGQGSRRGTAETRSARR